MNKNAKIFVAGHRGLVGSALFRRLCDLGYQHLIVKSSDELDLRNQQSVTNFFDSERPDYVFLAAAKVGGILANASAPGSFIYDNLMIQTNVIHQAYMHHVKKLIFLGSSCIYPKHARLPISEDQLLQGPLESTNEPYAIAKIAGLKMCEAYKNQFGCHFITVMPCNLYGPNDNFDPTTSHVLPALIQKIHTARIHQLPTVTIWGSGKPRREFLHVDDLAAACIMLMKKEGLDYINIGSGSDISILELANLISDVIGYKGTFVFDRDKPDGTDRKVLDISRISALGWAPSISLKEGIEKVYHNVFKPK